MARKKITFGSILGSFLFGDIKSPSKRKRNTPSRYITMTGLNYGVRKKR